MAVATEFLYRNYDSSDATISTAYSNELFPTIENVGWAAQAGHIFKEWNTSRDGTGASFDPGDSFPSPASYTTFYAIWEECDVSISYKGSAITTMSASGTEVLETNGKFMTDDITVSYTKSGGGGGGPSNLIRFGLFGAYVFCEDGMTWREYVEWDYRVGKWPYEGNVPTWLGIYGNYVGTGYTWKLYYYSGNNRVYVSPDDVIVADIWYDEYYDD